MQDSDRTVFLTQMELAERWKVSGRTLEGWRYHGKGPRYCLLGSRVRYPLSEVARFESAFNVAEWEA